MSDPKPPRGTTAAAAGTGKDNNANNNKEKKESLFPVGIVGQRELKTALQKSRNPAETIRDFQTSHSLNAMLAKAFGTIPTAKFKATRSSVNEGRIKEPLDTDPVMTFLSHLGVRQQTVHEKISNKLLKLLEEAIQKTDDEAAVLSLLSSCWFYVTSITELEPVLLAVLKRLGKNTPPAMLQTLVERNTTPTSSNNNNSNSGSGSTAFTDTSNKRNELKYGRIFDKLQYTLKRLCWECDWERRVVGLESSTTEPVEVLSQMEGTLFYETVQPLLQNYISNDKLRLLANLPFVETVSERKILTVQRRALSKAGQQNTIFHQTGESIQQIGTLIGYASGSLSSATMLKTSQSGGANASQRPQLLYAVIAILMTMHGLPSTPEFLAGGDHLHCTLLSDLLLSLGGPLPKAYTDVLALTRVLDECVQEGNVSDPNLVKIQAALRLIFPADGTDNNNTDTNNGETASTATATNQKNTATSKTTTLSNAELRQLNQIITSGLTALKEADSQNLFLNPVTDAIAPGYSKIIKVPMCVSTMEDKVTRNQYDSVAKWQGDVELMFKNCITYNRGPAGQWFRDEAHRQAKHFREVVVPPRLTLAQEKIASSSSVVSPPLMNQSIAGGSNVINMNNKRERDYDATDPKSSSTMIVPLEPVTKKRKKGTTKDEKQLPSMPAMATMLLCDPFVVRIIIDRILREVRQSVLQGNLLPPSHQVIPSLLQLLHLARWSKQICAVRGRKYFIPSAGLEGSNREDAEVEEKKKKDPATVASYTCLRRSLPAIAGLLLEAEFDFRCTSIGGDLQQAAQVSESLPTFNFDFDLSSSSKEEPAHVAAALLAGAFVTVCQPKSRREDRSIALEVTFPKFGVTLCHAKLSFLDDRLFFTCLIRALVRHRTKLTKAARDSIVTTWQSWLAGRNDSGDNNDSDTKAAVLTSTAHEHLIKLFNQWSSMGNVLLPRDDLLRFTKATVEILGTSEFVSAFNHVDDKSQAAGSSSFKKVRDQYIYMLKHLPVNIAKQWLADLELDQSILATKEIPPETLTVTTAK